MADDIRLNISADDEGARRLVEQLTEALRVLFQQQERSARTAAKAAASSRAQAAASRAEATALRAQIAAMRQQTASANANIASVRLQTAQAVRHTAQIRAQAQALRAASVAQAQYRRQLSQSTSGSASAGAIVSGLTRRLVLLAAVLEGFRGFRLFKAFIDEGLRFNEVIETAELGIGALITATSEVRDPFGNLLTDAEALDTAIGLAERQVQKLRVAGLQTAATTDELVQAYESAVAAGIAAGLKLDEIRKITVQIVQAAGAIGLPMQQLEQEVRSVLDATIDRNSRVARVLNITNEQVRLAKEQNRLADYLDSKLRSFTVSGERAMETFRVMKSNLQEALQVFSGIATEPFFDSLKRAGLGILDQFFDFNAADVSDKFRPLLTASRIFFDEFGLRVERAIDGILGSAGGISQWLDENQHKVREFSISLFDMLSAIGQWFKEVGALVGDLLSIFTGGGGIVSVMDAIAGAFETFNLVIQGVRDIIDGIREQSIVAKVGVVGLGAAIITLLAPLAGAKIGLLALAAIAAQIASMIGRKNRQQREAAEADDRAHRAQLALIGSTADLVTEIQRLDDTIKDPLNEKERESAMRRQEVIIERLLELYPQWSDELKDAARHNKNVREEVEKLTKAQYENAASWAFSLKAMITQQQAELDRIKGAELFFNEDEAGRIEHTIDAALRIAQLTKEYEQAVEVLEEMKKLMKDVSGATLTPLVRDPDAADRARKAADDFAQMIRARIDEIKAAVRTFEEVHKALFDQFELGIDEYFRSLTSRQQAAIDEQIRLLGQLKERTADAGEARKIEADIFELNQERQRVAIKNAADLRKEHEQLTDSIQELTVRSLELTGQHVEAAGLRSEKEFRDLRKRLEVEIAAMRVVLASLSPTTPAFAAALARLHQLMEAEINIEVVVDHSQIDAAGKVLKSQLADLRASIDEESTSIDLAEAVGLTRQDEIAQRVIRMHERQLASLRRLKAGWLEMVGSIDTEVERRQLQELEDQIARVEIALEEAVQAAKILRNALRDAVQGGIETLLTSGLLDAFDSVFRQQQQAREEIEATADEIDRALERHGVGVQQRTQEIREYIQTASSEIAETVTLLDVLKEAFRSFALGVVEALQRVVAQIIAMRIVTAGLNFLSAGISGAAGVADPTGGVARGATGGFVWGPGTETSDSIPARLSRGEYVINARAVRMIGRDVLDDINYGRQQPRVRRRFGFAQGGFVQAPASADDRKALSSQLTLGLEDGLVLRHMETNEGQKVLVRNISKNRQAIRKALGLR